MSGLTPLFTKINPSVKPSNTVLRELDSSYPQDYPALVQAMNQTAQPGFWRHGLDGQALTTASDVVSGLSHRQKDDAVMMMTFTAALAEVHGVSKACRDASADRIGVFSNPAQWQASLATVCDKVSAKVAAAQNPKQPVLDFE